MGIFPVSLYSPLVGKVNYPAAKKKGRVTHFPMEDVTDGCLCAGAMIRNLRLGDSLLDKVCKNFLDVHTKDYNQIYRFVNRKLYRMSP